MVSQPIPRSCGPMAHTVDPHHTHSIYTLLHQLSIMSIIQSSIRNSCHHDSGNDDCGCFEAAREVGGCLVFGDILREGNWAWISAAAGVLALPSIKFCKVHSALPISMSTCTWHSLQFIQTHPPYCNGCFPCTPRSLHPHAFHETAMSNYSILSTSQLQQGTSWWWSYQFTSRYD